MTKVVQGLELAPLAPGATERSARESPVGTTAPGECLGERMDLVEHLKVQLTVTLGSAEMDVARLFAMASGELVVLDREVESPVDVRLGDKLIARGELVAAGDRFAVRITEIAAD
jgi:flagellar motor switch protein FliN/FliY